MIHTTLNIELESMEQLEKIIHKNLVHIGLELSSSLQFTIKGDASTAAKKTKVKVNTAVGNLKSISIVIHWLELDNLAVFQTLRNFDKFLIRHHVQCYMIDWDVGLDDFLMYVEGWKTHKFQIFEQILFQDYDKHPYLEKIQILLDADPHLCRLANVLAYFGYHCQQLFEETKFHLTSLNKIEIKFKETFKNHLITPFDYDAYGLYPQLKSMMNQTSNEKYSVNKNVIKIDIKQEKEAMKSFGIIYQNVVCWLQARQIQRKNKSQNHTRKGSIKNCKLVLVLSNH